MHWHGGLKAGPTDLGGWGFFITGASVQLLQLHGELRHDKNDEGGGTEKENSEMDDGSCHPWCQGTPLVIKPSNVKEGRGSE